MSYRANLNISKKHIGFLIGPKGKIINGLKRKHGVYASIDERNCVYRLNGPQAAVEAAINDIRTHINWINGIKPKTPKRKAIQPQQDGWSVVTTRAKKATPAPTPEPVKTAKNGQYETLESSDDESDESESNIRLPQSRPAPKLLGVWSKKPRVTFAHDATGQDEIREFYKNEPPIAVSSGSDDEPNDDDIAYMAKKKTKKPWKSSGNIAKLRDIAREKDESKKSEMKTAYKQQKTTKKRWADLVDEMSEDESDEESEFDYTNIM